MWPSTNFNYSNESKIKIGFPGTSSVPAILYMITIRYFSRHNHGADITNLPRVDTIDPEKKSDVDIICQAQALVNDLNPSCVDCDRQEGYAGDWRNVASPLEKAWLKLTMIGTFPHK